MVASTPAAPPPRGASTGQPQGQRILRDGQTPDEVMTKVLDDYARNIVALDS